MGKMELETYLKGQATLSLSLSLSLSLFHCARSLLLLGLSLVVLARATPLAGFSLWRLLLLWSTGSRVRGLQELWLLDSRA